MTEYIIVKAGTLNDLVNAVNRNITEGYTPIGSVTFVPTYSDNSGKSYVQAMVKYELE